MLTDAQKVFSKGQLTFVDADKTVITFSLWQTERRVVVNNIPASMTEESLIVYLESKRVGGGGGVVDIQYNTTKHCAIVTYKEWEGKSTI